MNHCAHTAHFVNQIRSTIYYQIKTNMLYLCIDDRGWSPFRDFVIGGAEGALAPPPPPRNLGVQKKEQKKSIYHH